MARLLVTGNLSWPDLVERYLIPTFAAPQEDEGSKAKSINIHRSKDWEKKYRGVEQLVSA
jgi:hypothetical protein